MNDWSTKSVNKLNPNFNMRSAVSYKNSIGNQKSNAAAVKSLLSGQRNLIQENGPSKSEQHLMLDLPDNLIPGDKLYALVDGIPYEIIAGENNEYIATPATSINIDEFNALQANNLDHTESMFKEDSQINLSPMLNATEHKQQRSNEFVLQPSMLPPEIQEMVAKGQIDLSNYEFVIQDDATGTQQQVFLTDGNGEYDAAILQQLMQQQQDTVNGQAGDTNNAYDVLSMLADASSQQESAINVSDMHSRMISADMTCDDEFLYVMVSENGEEDAEVVADGANYQPLQLNDGYATAYDRYLKGMKLETLSAVTSSAILSRPPMPMYDPALCRPSIRGAHARQAGNVGRPPINRSIATPYRQSPNVPAGRIIKRKTRGSDDDSFEESDLDSGGSDPGWKPRSENEGGRKTVFPWTRPVSRGRGRGRPRGSASRGVVNFVKPPTIPSTPQIVKKLITQSSVQTTNNNHSIISTNCLECHNYQKGDFVLERKDVHKTCDFPLWRIEAGRLLQKYDYRNLEQESMICHKSASVYSSWSGDIKTNFKAVLVDVITPNVKRNEIVQLRENFKTKPFDENLESHPLIELFNIYVQNMVSQALDPTFMSAIFQQNEDYYLGPLRQINMLLDAAQKTLLNDLSWQKIFKDAVDETAYYRIQEAPITTKEALICQATYKTCSSTKLLTLFGPKYDDHMVEVQPDSGGQDTHQAFFIGSENVDKFETYHNLHHFQFLLFKHSQEEITYRRKVGKDKSDEVLLAETLQTRIWVQQHLQRLIELLEKCSIVVSVVMQEDEDNDVAEPKSPSSQSQLNLQSKMEEINADEIENQQQLEERKEGENHQAVAIIDENGQQTVALLDADGQTVIAILDPNDPQTLALLAGQQLPPNSFSDANPETLFDPMSVISFKQEHISHDDENQESSTLVTMETGTLGSLKTEEEADWTAAVIKSDTNDDSTMKIDDLVTPRSDLDITTKTELNVDTNMNEFANIMHVIKNDDDSQNIVVEQASDNL